MAQQRGRLGPGRLSMLSGVAALIALSGTPALASDPSVDDAAATPPTSVADRHRAQAVELYRLGRFEEAAVQWQQAAQTFGAQGDRAAQVSALLGVADAQHALGRYEDALGTLSRALDLLGKQGDAAQLAAIHGSIGNARIALGPPELARQHLEKGVELAREADASALAAAILTNLGNLHASLLAYAEASRAYRESAALAEQSDRPALAAQALANAARAGIEQGTTPEETRSLLARASDFARELPDSHDKAYLLINLGRSYGRLPAASSNGPDSDVVHAHDALREADRVAGRIDDRRSRSYATGYLGTLYEERHRYDEAVELSQRAVFLAQEAGAPESLYRWLWQLGRIHRTQGEALEAIDAYRRAVEVLEGIRYEMAHGYATGGMSFREVVGPIYFELVDIMLQSAPPPSEVAAHQARLLEARETVESLKAAELRDYFRDECVDAVQAKVESLDQVAETALVIYPILLQDRLELLLTLPSGMKRTTVDVGVERLTQEVRQLRYLLEKRTTREYLPHAQRLYDWLVRPYEAELAGLSVDTLVFVPGGALRTIPMAALHDGKAFLVDRYALAVTPGLSLTDPRPLDRENLKVFLAGLSEPVQGFPPLDHVPAELGSIQSLYGGDVLLDEDFQLARVEDTLSDQEFNVVHIASHGEFSDDVEKSFLLTYDDRLTMDRLADYVGLFRFRETPIELLVLSACETAQGNDRAALGLAGVAIKAGARSALGTLWRVNDAASAELVSEFYQQIRDAPSKAFALQRAQQKLRADPDYQHPFYWSAFLLISNWL